MKFDKLILLICLILRSTIFVQAQIKFKDASEFKLLGKISDDTETLYERLPAFLKNLTREPVWNLGKNTSGLAIRFRSNSSSVSAKWEVLANVNLNHMTQTGVKGLDLYAWKDNSWQFVNSARPTGKINEVVIISNMDAVEREYILYLPLYDGVINLQIGVDSTAFIEMPKLAFPDTDNPIVFYGTSITQGGCATRPGMSYPNILNRFLNQEIINLGFSGNGQLDYEIADLMRTKTNASLFVLDFIPNVSLEQIKEKTIPFVNKLRDKDGKIPILFVESVLFTHLSFDNVANRIVADKNKELKNQFQKLKSLGYENIHFLSAENLIGIDGEATVDGVHLTDLGFLRMAEVLKTEIDKIIKK